MAIDPPELLKTNVGVYLSRGEAGVTEEFLYYPDVCSCIEHVGGKGVPEHVRCHRFGPTPFASIPIQDVPDPTGGQSSAPKVEKERVGVM